MRAVAEKKPEIEAEIEWDFKKKSMSLDTDGGVKVLSGKNGGLTKIFKMTVQETAADELESWEGKHGHFCRKLIQRQCISTCGLQEKLK